MSEPIDMKALGELRSNFSKVVARAQMGIPTIGTNRGKQVVAVVPIEVLDKYLASEQEELRRLIGDRREEETVSLTAEMEAVVDMLPNASAATEPVVEDGTVGKRVLVVDSDPQPTATGELPGQQSSEGVAPSSAPAPVEGSSS